MPEETPPSSTPAPIEPSKPLNPPIAFHIGEEFSSPSKKLPPAGILVICMLAVAVIIGLIAFVWRPQSLTTGSIDTVTPVEVPGQNSILLAINISMENPSEKPYIIHAIHADLETSTGKFSDTAASAIDFDRYYQAFPALKRAPLDPLKPEDKLAPGGKARGTIIVSFPVTADAFTNRKSLTVTIEPYDEPVPLVMTK